MTAAAQSASPVAPACTTDPVRTDPIHAAEDLLSGGDTARIVLRDQIYTLRLTRSGKLILTK